MSLLLRPLDVEFSRRPVTCDNGSGRAYTRWLPDMPKLGKYAPILKTVFFLYSSKEDARAGTNSGGTGFLVAVPSARWGEQWSHIHAITNWHVAVYNEDGPPAPVIRINRHSGPPDIFDLDPAEWIFAPHSYDVAISPPLELRKEHDAVFLSRDSFFLSPEKEKEDEIGPADDVFMIGRFVDYDGAEANQPAMRFGHISIIDAQIKQYTGFTGRSIVVDMHSRGGFSGSPVFVYRTIGSHFFESKPGQVLTGGGHYINLLGMHWGQFPEQWEIKDRAKLKRAARGHSGLIVEGQYVDGLSGMTCVIPATNIDEVLSRPELKEMRREREARAAAKHAKTLDVAPKPESSGPPANDLNPTHREDFTSLLNAAAKTPSQGD